jgi:hypothetical protein
MDPLQDIDPQWRTLVIAAVALAYPVGMTGFELGAYGEIFFDNMLSAWITVTAVLIILVAVPRKKLPGHRMHIWVLAIPSLWMLGRFITGLSSPGDLVHPLLFVTGAISFALCVPYAIYLVVRIANPELPDLRETRMRIFLALIAIAFLGAGYGIGLRNELFQTCEELQVHDEVLPAHCVDNGDSNDSQSK